MKRQLQPKLIPAQRFTQYLPMAHKIAHNFANRWQIPIGEMVDLAESTLGEICTRWADPTYLRAYNADRGCNETSWVYRALFYEMLTQVDRGQFKNFHKTVSISCKGNNERPVDFRATPAKQGWLETLFRSLGEDAKVIAQTLLFAPEEIFEEVGWGVASWARYATQEYLRKRRGWSRERFYRAWEELGAAL